MTKPNLLQQASAALHEAAQASMQRDRAHESANDPMLRKSARDKHAAVAAEFEAKRKRAVKRYIELMRKAGEELVNAL